MDSTILSVKNVTQRYGQTLALDDVSIELEQGRFTVWSETTAQERPH